MADFPALPFFTDSYMGDCWHLSDAEHGRYLMLLILMWQSPGCRIPNDPEWIARKLKRPVADVERDIMPIVKEFCVSTGNWITQKRLQQEFRYVSSKHKTQSEKAKSMWQKKKKNAAASAGHKPDEGERHKPETPSAYAPNPTQPNPTQPIKEAKPRVDWNGLETELRKAAGWEREPHPNLAIVGPIADLIENEGADLHADILPIVKAKAAHARSRTSWKFFIPPIRERLDERKVSKSNGSAKHPARWNPDVDLNDSNTWDRRAFENYVEAAKRSNRWDVKFCPPEKIPKDLVDDALREIIGIAA